MAYFTPAAVLIVARIRVYVPQRQMLPSIALSIWVSVGLGVFLNRAAACMIWPLWQYPHWATWCVSQATWHGCAPFALRPSMVVILFPAAALRGVTQLRIASPLKWTVQAPHNPMPHPISSAFLSRERGTHVGSLPGSFGSEDPGPEMDTLCRISSAHYAGLCDYHAPLRTKQERVVISAGGMNQFGTPVAGEFLCDPVFWRETASSAPRNWGQKNMQAVCPSDSEAQP